MDYIWFFLQALGYVLEWLLPYGIFIIAQQFIAKHFEEGLMHAFGKTDNLSDFKKSPFGYTIIRFFAMPGVWLQSKILQYVGLLFGFKTSSPKPFSVQLDELNNNQELTDMGEVIFQSRDPKNVRGGKRKVFNWIMLAISRLFGAIVFVAPIIIFSHVYKFIFMYKTVDVHWITTDAYIPSNNLFGAIPKMLSLLFTAWKEILTSPTTLIASLAVTLFLVYGLTLSQSALDMLKKNAATFVVVMWMIFAYDAAAHYNLAPATHQSFMYCLVIFPLILLFEAVWTIVFNLIATLNFNKNTSKFSQLRKSAIQKEKKMFNKEN